MMLAMLVYIFYIICGFTFHGANCFKSAQYRQIFKHFNNNYVQIPSRHSQVRPLRDYASEITNAVGSEIYGPIFKAGLFLIVSGIFSAGIVSTIISKSNTWNELGDEFERGKQSQLSSMSSTNNDNEITKSESRKLLNNEDSINDDVTLLDI